MIGNLNVKNKWAVVKDRANKCNNKIVFTYMKAQSHPLLFFHKNHILCDFKEGGNPTQWLTRILKYPQPGHVPSSVHMFIPKQTMTWLLISFRTQNHQAITARLYHQYETMISPHKAPNRLHNIYYMWISTYYIISSRNSSGNNKIRFLVFGHENINSSKKLIFTNEEHVYVIGLT